MNLQPAPDDALSLLRLHEPVPLEGKDARAAATAWLPDVAAALGIPKPELEPGPVAYDPAAGRHLHPHLDKTWFGLHAIAWRARERGLEHLHREDVVLLVRERAGQFVGVAAQRARRAAGHPAPLDAGQLAAFLKDAAPRVAKAIGPSMQNWLGKGWTIDTLTPVLAGPVPLRGADDEGAAASVPWSLLPPEGKPGRGVAVEVEVVSPVVGRVRLVVRVHDLAVLDLGVGGAGVASVKVWDWDPITSGSGLTSASTSAALNALATPHTAATTLSNKLITSRVQLVTTPAPSVNPDVWSQTIETLEGARVHAFWHADAALAQIEDLGFPLVGAGGYLVNQSAAWPLPVDAVANAGSSTPWGVGYAYASSVTMGALVGSTRSEALDRRVVWHEVFGHVVLYNHVGDHRASTGIFTHSAGDSFAAILGDVDDPVRGHRETFPYTFPAADPLLWTDTNTAPRRHDRDPSAGSWGWGDGLPGGGTTSGYGHEQKLSSTLFRVYRSLGGDSSSPSTRRLAARTTAWLTLQAIGMLTPGTRPQSAEAFAATLQAADLADWTTQGWWGGAYNKVVRWAFEKQGAYQAPLSAGAPYDTVGTPPDVDIYFPDARNGEYGHTSSWAYDSAIWNRLAPDGLTTHQQPVVGVPNHLYVRLKNRGPQPAGKGQVTAWVREAGVGSEWPTGWSQVGGAVPHPTLAGSSAVEKVVGPFTWIPKPNVFHAFLGVVDNPDDRPNTQHFDAAHPVALHRLVPHDNNVVLRQTWWFKLVLGLKLPKLPGLVLSNPSSAAVQVVVTPSVTVGGVPSRTFGARLSLRPTRLVLAPGASTTVPAPGPGVVLPKLATAAAKGLVLGLDVTYDDVHVGGARWIGRP